MNKQIYNLLEKCREEIENLYGRDTELTDEITDMMDKFEHQLTNGWIPVSERLPEESIDGITDDYVSYNVSLKFEYAECTRTYKFGNGRWWNDGTDMSEYVIAWQPLPPKYEEVSE